MSFKIHFGITREALGKKVIRRQMRDSAFVNFLYRHKREGCLAPEEMRTMWNKWKSLSKEQKDKYKVIQPDGSVRLDKLDLAKKCNEPTILALE